MTVPPKPRVLLAVIDGLGSAAFERAVQRGDAPVLASLIEAGATRGEAISPFPSLTPVCLSTIATGALPDRHRIPSLAWFHRGERRYVEYGSSFSASSVEGTAQTVEDVMLNLNHVHLAEHPTTIFEHLEAHGIETAAINYLVHRGRTRHELKWSRLNRVARKMGQPTAVHGPTHFVLGELFSSSRPWIPQMGIKRPNDWSASQVARHLLRTTDAGFVLMYLGGHDAAAHRRGPDDTARAVRIADRAIGRVITECGGIDALGEELALIVVADHAQSTVWPGQHARLTEAFGDWPVYLGRRGPEIDECLLAVAPSNRCAMVYRLSERHSPTAEAIAERAAHSMSVDIAAWRDRHGVCHARRGSRELRFERDTGGFARGIDVIDWSGTHWTLDGDPAALDLTIEADGELAVEGAYPDALARLYAALHCVNAGDVLLSARVGWEYIDLGGGYHTGGSHGSLHVVDSVAPLVCAGIRSDAAPADGARVRLADVRRIICNQLGLPVE